MIATLIIANAAVAAAAMSVGLAAAAPAAAVFYAGLSAAAAVAAYRSARD